MNSFKQLVTEVRTQMDKDVEFLIDHGIDPSTKYSNVPLYDPEQKSLIVLRGPSKTSPYFKDGKVHPQDTVFIQAVKEYRIPSTKDAPGNYYVKEYDKNKKEITVDQFKKIYNDASNEETIAYLRLQDLDTIEQQAQVKDTYTTARDLEDKTAKKNFEEWVRLYGDFFDLDNLPEADRKEALTKLYKANKSGYAVEDLSKLPIIWQVKNKKTLGIIDSKIKQIENPEKAKEIKDLFGAKKKEWFNAQLDIAETLKAALQWWKEIEGTKESVLDEYSFSPSQKATPIKDKYEVKKTLEKLFGLDADKFITVPIIKEPVYNKQKYKSAADDPLADPLEKLVVVSFPDQSKLDDKFGLVRVKDIVSNTSYNMNIGELRALINREENKDTELDTIQHRLTGGNEFTTLNPGMGHFVELPEEVIVEMLKAVNTEYEEFEYVDLVKYYEKEKESGISNPLLTKALNLYNQGHANNVVRKFNTAMGIKYKGFIPSDEHIRSKPASAGKDKYKQLMK